MEQDDSTAAIVAARPRLVEMVVEAHYRNPYWEDRFGERGLRFTIEDTGHLLDSLETALVFGGVALGDYCRWLQRLLTRRALCTLHLDEALTYLGDAIERCISAELADRCRPLLQAGSLAMRYPPPAGDVQSQAGTIIAALGAGARNTPPVILAETPYYLSFLADALANESDAQLIGYLRWSSGFYSRQGLRPDTLASLLTTLGGMLPGEHPGGIALERARTALRERVE